MPFATSKKGTSNTTTSTRHTNDAAVGSNPYMRKNGFTPMTDEEKDVAQKFFPRRKTKSQLVAAYARQMAIAIVKGK